jgi:hypothetical protein
MVRTRFRKPRQAKHSKGRTRNTKINIPPELRASMTTEIEQDLKNLVTKFGEKKVLEALGPLITECKWNDWQCVANGVRRIARQK